MKYIRTAYQILKIENISKPIYVKGKGEVIAYHFYDKQNNYKVGESLNKNVKQADTIEELCDCYSYETETTRDYQVAKCWKQADKSRHIYGCILTDTGIIRVAEMNEEGGLELL